MALNKTKSNRAAAIHALMYTSAFLPHKPSLPALVGIAGTHYAIDRYGLARYVLYAKNLMAPGGMQELQSIIDHRYIPTISNQGMPAGTPDGLATGLFIVADNTLHLLLNALFLRRDE